MSLREMVWTEKYRPKTIEEILDREEIVSKLKTFVKSKSMPHLLFVGPAGTSKTTAALALVNDIYNGKPEGNYIELNASVTPETPVLIRENGVVRRSAFGEIANRYFSDDLSSYARPSNLEALSVDENYSIAFRSVSLISRHRVRKIAEIRYESGIVRTSLDHSVITVDGEGNLISKRVAELGKGDLLITFSTSLEGDQNAIDLKKYSPQPFLKGTIPNPKVKKTFDRLVLTGELSWLLGTYLAEGCVGFRGDTSGQVIFSFGYPQEMETAEKAQKILQKSFGLQGKTILSGSGFNRAKYSSVQLRACNTQVAKFFKDSFYVPNGQHIASVKIVPSFIFETNLENRYEFLKGYMGDGCGDWGEFVRYISSSRQNLIDVAWLGRISGLDTSCFKREARIVWKLPSYSYIKTEFVPAEPLTNLFNEIGFKPKFRYALRHQLYSKKSKRISKKTARELLEKISSNELSAMQRENLKNIRKLIDSPLSTVLVRNINIREYEGYVYDFSVPGAQVFWGGTTPVLLHNSDERGIDVVRFRVKEFARSVPMAEVPFKIIVLDECDSMCLPPGTQVIIGSPKSNRIATTPIERLNENRWRVMPSVNLETGEIEDDHGLLVDSGYAEFYKITLENAESVVASPEHPFFVMKNAELNAVRLKELKVGDEIVDYSDKIMRKCEICSKRTLNERFCSRACANKGHSLDMEEKRNPMFGKRFGLEHRLKLSKGIRRAIRLGILKNPNLKPEVRTKKSLIMKRLWEDPTVRNRLLKGSTIMKTKYKGKSDMQIMGFERAERKRLLASSTYRENGIFLDSRYRRYVPKTKWTKCQVCDKKTETHGSDGIYVHHIDGNPLNNKIENIVLICPRCHNILHDVATRSWSDERRREWSDELKHRYSERKRLELPFKLGAPIIDPVKVTEIEYVGRGKAWNVRMRKNPCFILGNGIITHNTDEAQQALRRTMERFSVNTRFILIANELYKIIEPIQSRCSVFRFGPLPDRIIADRIKEIAKKEGVQYEEEAMNLMVDRAYGDMRMAINLAQGAAAENKKIDLKNVRQFLGAYGLDRIDDMFEKAVSGDFNGAIGILDKLLYDSGVPPREIARKIQKRTYDLNASPERKMDLLSVLAEVEYRLTVGADPEIQFSLFLAKLSETPKR